MIMLFGWGQLAHVSSLMHRTDQDGPGHINDSSACCRYRASTMRPLLIDPSGRGGIVRYTRLLAQALHVAGAQPTVLGCRTVSRARGPYAIRSWLPKQRWGRPQQRALWPTFYSGRALAWLLSAGVVDLTVRLDRPDVVHFQSPINRHFDAQLLRHVRQRAPVVWTAHDVLPN